MSNTTKKKIISLEVRDEYILGSGVAIGAVGSHASILLRIKFNENWDALNIHATWTDAIGTDGEDYNQLLLPSHEVEERTYEIGVPAFATRHSGTVRLSFSGFAIGEDGEEISQVINTASGLFKVLDSNAVRLDDEKINATSEEQVQAELNAFGERMTGLEGEMDERDTALDKAENGYTDDDGKFVPGRVQKELERQENEDARAEAEKQRQINEFGAEGNKWNDERTAVVGENGEPVENANAGRVGAELDRVEAEGERSRAEEDRVLAEKGRDAAEKLREEAAATILGKIAQHTNEISGINETLAKHEGEIADLEAQIDEGIGSDYEIPTFNLFELGLPIVEVGGDFVAIETDTAQMIAALEKGPVNIILQINMGTPVTASFIFNPTRIIESGIYTCTVTNELEGEIALSTIAVQRGVVGVKCTLMNDIIGAYIDTALGGDY